MNTIITVDTIVNVVSVDAIVVLIKTLDLRKLL